MVNLLYDCYCVLSKVYCDGAYIKQAILSTVIEPLNKPKTVKICYGVLDKDIELDYYLDRLCEKKPKQKIRIILKIAFYAIKYLEKKPYAVTTAAVELSKKLGKSGNAAFINAVLRRFSSETIPLPSVEIDNLSIRYSYPVFALEKLIKEYGREEAEKIASFDEEATFVRFNDGINGEKYLSERGFDFRKTPFEGLYSVVGITKNDDFDDGIFTFQSIGSVAICEIVGGGEKLLDCCAAPGGKSVYLSDVFSFVTSTEIREHRAELIRSYVKRMKKDNVTVLCLDSTVFKKDFKKAFDHVLCDVPCSGYGTIKNNPDIKLNRTEEGISELTETQFAILKNCSEYVKVGGVLVYSTCTFFEEENDRVIEKFLKINGDFIVEKTTSPLNFVSKKYGLQFLPHISSGAGFYCAKLKRVK